MKVLKGISLFFVYPLVMLFAGFWIGVTAERFFYPGEEIIQKPKVQNMEAAQADDESGDAAEDATVPSDMVEVSVRKETLCADTEYVLEEVDVIRETSVETTRRLPSQYIGMDREQFMVAMENVQAAPSLVEQERGFESLEVLSFSRERVRVRMNYRYVQPGQGFYLAVRDHEIVVYLDDKETIYMSTGIMLQTLPESMQMDIIQMYYVEGEGNLYNFLETYSS